MTVTTDRGYEQQGRTLHRPLKPPHGFFYFDSDIGFSLCWDGSEWRPASVGIGTVAQRPDADAVPVGTLFFNLDSASMETSDGVTWLELSVTDNQSSSSTSSSSSTESSSSVGSSSSSSLSSSSESTSSSSQS